MHSIYEVTSHSILTRVVAVSAFSDWLLLLSLAYVIRVVWVLDQRVYLSNSSLSLSLFEDYFFSSLFRW